MIAVLVKQPFFIGKRYFPKGRAELNEADLGNYLVQSRTVVFGGGLKTTPEAKTADNTEVSTDETSDNDVQSRSGRRGRRPRSDN